MGHVQRLIRQDMPFCSLYVALRCLSICHPVAIQLLWNGSQMPKEAEFRQTIEAFPVPVFIFDAGRRPGPIMVNSLMCKLLGYTEMELIADWKQVLPPGFLVVAEKAIHSPS